MLIKCPECKTKISDSAERCPKCGFFINEEIKENSFLELNKRKKRKKVIAIFFFIIFIATIGFSVFYFSQKNKENIRQEKIRKEKEKQEEKEYIENHKNYITVTVKCLLSAEELTGELAEKNDLISSVWHNCIWEEKDKKTNKYTMKNGKFVDFNDGVNKCIGDEFSEEKFLSISTDFFDYYKELKSTNLVEKDKEKYNEYDSWVRDLAEYVNSYYNFLYSPNGNYSEFTETANEYYLLVKEKLDNTPYELENVIKEYVEYS